MNENPRCSVESLAADEPLAGSAPRARAWLILEQSGPYGFDALSDSHLPAEVRLALAEAGKETGTNVLLARPVGQHADTHVVGDSRRFWLAHCAPGGARMRSGVLADAELTRPDLRDVLSAASHGELPPWGSRTSDPLMLVCTNSKRDLCCALEGRPLAEALSADPTTSESVLEVSHIGGHRFAPTVLLLPTGHVYGRLNAEQARSVLIGARSGKLLHPEHLRGRSSAAQPAQVAAVAIRTGYDIEGLDSLDVLRKVGDKVVPFPLRWDGEDGHAEIEVRHRDGRAWSVSVAQSQLLPRSESCGKPAKSASVWKAESIETLPAWF
ncbi:MAG: sucrase ferredoxin [Actinomycetes bacterium]